MNDVTTQYLGDLSEREKNNNNHEVNMYDYA